MDFSALGGMIRSGVKSNSNIILSVLAGAGTVTTAYLTGRASYKAAEVIRAHESVNGTPDNRKERVKERTKLVWKFYIPSAASAVGTISCIVGLNRIGLKRTLAAQTALSASEAAFSEYRDKVREQLGARKDEAIRDQVAEDRVLNKPPPSKEVIVSGPGNVLCCELFTGRYFTSDVEKLRRAENEVNAKALAHDYATLDDFYYLVGLGFTSTSNYIGWKSDKLMKLEISAVLTADERPCLAFSYNYTTSL